MVVLKVTAAFKATYCADESIRSFHLVCKYIRSIKGAKWSSQQVYNVQHNASHTVYCKFDTFLRYEGDNWMRLLCSQLVIVGCLSLASTSTDSNKQLDIFAGNVTIRRFFKCLTGSFVCVELNKFESAPAQALREMSPADSGYNYADQLSKIEDQLLGRDVYVKEGSPFRMYSRFKQANPESRTYAEKAARLIQATKSLKK